MPLRLWFDMSPDFGPGFSGGTGGEPQTYGTLNVDALVHVYPFRQVPSNFIEIFQQTLLRDWVPLKYRDQGQLLVQPEYQAIDVPGAEQALLVGFTLGILFSARYHMCVAIRAGEWGTMVEFAAKKDSVQRYWPGIDGFLRTLRIANEPAPAPIAQGSNLGLAGLYMHTGLSFGLRGAEMQTEFYLLSATTAEPIKARSQPSSLALNAASSDRRTFGRGVQNFALPQAAAAQDHVMAGGAIGKTVLTLAQD